MKRTPTLFTGLRALSLLLLLTLVGCSAFSPTSNPRLTISNRTDRTLLYMVLTSETAARIYIGRTILAGPDGEFSTPQLRPNGSATVTTSEILGTYEPGNSLVVVIFAVDEAQATQVDMFGLTDKQLHQRSWRLEISTIPSPSS